MQMQMSLSPPATKEEVSRIEENRFLRRLQSSLMDL